MNSTHLIFVAFIAFNAFINALAENAYYIISIKRNDNDKNFDDESDTVQTQIVELVNDRMNEIYEIIENNMDSYRLENGKMDEKLNEITLNSLKKRHYNKLVKFNFINKSRPVDISINDKYKRSINSTDLALEYISIDSDLIGYICPVLNYYTIKAYLTDDVIDKVLNLENVISCEKDVDIGNSESVNLQELYNKRNNNKNGYSSNGINANVGENGKYYNISMIKEETNWLGVSVQEQSASNNQNYLSHLSLISQSKYYPLNTNSFDYNYYYPESAGQGIDLFFIDEGIDLTYDSSDFNTYDGSSYQRTITCDARFYDGEMKEVEKEKYCSITNKSNYDVSHGIAVASVAAGTLYGVAKKANIHMLATNFKYMDVLKALDHVKLNGLSHKTIISISRGGWNDYSVTLQNKITELTKAGIIIFTSAGNSNENCCVVKGNNIVKYYSYYDNVIVVGATTENYNHDIKDAYAFSGYSNFGDCVDIYAPGEGYYPSKTPVMNINGHSADIMTGTSIATPIVAGVAATIMSEHPDINFTYELMLKTLIDFSLKDVLTDILSYDTPNRFVNNGKKLVFSPTNYYNGCNIGSPIKTCTYGCCSKYGTCIDPSDDIYDLCYIGRGCQSEFGDCHETEAIDFIPEPTPTIINNDITPPSYNSKTTSFLYPPKNVQTDTGKLSTITSTSNNVSSISIISISKKDPTYSTKHVHTYTSTTKTIPMSISSTTKTTLMTITFTTKTIPIITTSTTKIIPLSTTSTTSTTITSTTSTTKTIPISTTSDTSITSTTITSTTSTTKTIPISTTITSTASTTENISTITTNTLITSTISIASLIPQPTEFSGNFDCFSCEKFDWDCKQKMSNACYQELNNCWQKPWHENQFEECSVFNEICSKIWN
ncbi:subtilisin-like protein [Anaeromyces robustus]|uniref:Subtilisin-like protein n=1 Tax=Anaeromyces robustus TaxID=1754192 RepID=A0A1Y1X359_9FUNG|nr:subtilisin-like protein [Anaeromyces robustus]|eukprot:ORX80250.1 subtilisin-like protein [Anaeromyces robustus]